MVLALLVACLTPAEQCRATCDALWDECGTEKGYDPIDGHCDQCDVASERSLDDWLECYDGAVESAEVAAYGWDAEACEAVASECGPVAY